ncbi:MAG: polyprenyl synthetase family protein [Chlamydiia bacterium]
MSLPESVGRLRLAIEAELQQMASAWQSQGSLGAALAYAVSGQGKRLRPILSLLLGSHLLHDRSAAQDHALLRAACGVELLHVASLIADDLPCMDDDEERHGRPSLHRRFDEATAILASVALVGEGFRLLTDACAVAPHTIHAIHSVSRIGLLGGVQGICGGQAMDLACARGEPVDMALMLSYKTSSLFEIALLAGWAFHPAPPDSVEPVTQMAHHLGLAYQCFDDLQDACQDGLANACRLWGTQSTLECAIAHWEAFLSVKASLGWDGEAIDAFCEWVVMQALPASLDGAALGRH